jgi:hypothetical protein
MRTSVNRLGRFSSPDPLAGSIVDPQSLNRYAYVLNTPVNLSDPLGLDGPCFPAVSCVIEWDQGGNDPGGLFGGGGAGGPIRMPLLDTPEVQRGGGRRNHVNKKVLNKCIQDLFGVTLKQFNESSQGQNGSFLGRGPDTLRNGGNDANISIINDVNSFSSQQLQAKGTKGGAAPPPPGRNILGLELPGNPYVNYAANNLSNYVVNQALVPNVMASIQVHELGNSLSDITGAAFNPATVPGLDKDPGQALENCVRNRGGFNP